MLCARNYSIEGLNKNILHLALGPEELHIELLYQVSSGHIRVTNAKFQFRSEVTLER